MDFWSFPKLSSESSEWWYRRDSPPERAPVSPPRNDCAPNGNRADNRMAVDPPPSHYNQFTPHERPIFHSSSSSEDDLSGRIDWIKQRGSLTQSLSASTSSSRRMSGETRRSGRLGGSFSKTQRAREENTKKLDKVAFQAWFRKSVLGSKTKRDASKKSKKEYPGLLVLDPTESSTIDQSSRAGHNKDDISAMIGSMSVEDIREKFGSKEDLRGTMVNRTRAGGHGRNSTTTGREAKIDFRNRLELYKAGSGIHNHEDTEPHIRRDPSFTLLSFSVAPSDSEDSNNSDVFSDKDSIEETLLDAIMEETGLRRLLTGKAGPHKKRVPKEETVAVPRDISVPKAPAVLSPRHMANDNREETDHRYLNPEEVRQVRKLEAFLLSE